ncbi:NUDIX domain-containing protein [bacterium]|nr:NUDIX domain-containing protein [bacterium]
MSKKLPFYKVFVFFILSSFLFINNSFANLFTSNPNDNDFLTSYIHINLSCKGCLTQRKTNAGCAIFKNGKLLLVKHKFTGKWGFPGGRDKLNGELAFQTAYRETLEETGYVVSIEKFITEFKNNFRLYKCKILKEQKNNNFYITEQRFFSKEEIFNLINNNKKQLRYLHQFDVIYSNFDDLSK